MALVAALAAATVPVRADLYYDASGDDLYRIKTSAAVSKVSYAGSERLSVRQEGHAWIFETKAQYARSGPDGATHNDADFVQVLTPDGSFEDRLDQDPDFLTILNQPFAIRLDPATLRDLRGLHGAVPFAATSPLGAEGVLHGFLRRAPGGPVDGHPTAAVRFEAAGAMTGPIPGAGQTLVSGTMRMDGTAYYSVDTAMLMALTVTLTLDARLAQGRPWFSVPVRIVYRRSLRAAKMPPQAQPATGAGTAAPATPSAR
jgi:hypothetical protein